MKRSILFPFFTALMALVTASSQAELIDGLRAYYTFDTDATDQLGTYHGTVVGASHTASGLIGGAYEFTDNQYIRIDQPLPVGLPLPVGNDARAISMWVKPTSDDVTGLFKAGTDGYGRDFSVWLECRPYGFGGGDDFIYVRRYYEDVQTERSSSIARDAWHHVVISYDGTTTHQIAIYLDGVLLDVDDDYSIDTTFDTASTAQSIGGGYMPSDSIIDEVGIWNRGLTTEDVAELYNNGAGTQFLTAVPEPATWLLMSGSLVMGFGFLRCRRQKPA